MSVRTYAGFERQPDHVAVQMIQCIEKALQSSGSSPVDIFVSEWREHIRMLGGEVIYSEACYQAVKSLVWLHSVENLQQQRKVLTAEGNTILAEELLKHVKWNPISQGSDSRYIVRTSTGQGQSDTRMFH